MDKKKIKTVIIVLILFLVGVAAVFGINIAKNYFSGASAGEEPKDVRIKADISSATITWQSDKETMGIVEYGTNQASLLLRAVETQATLSHRVVLSPLKSDATYYFRVKVGETIFDSNGIPYSFKTKVEGTPEVTSAPTITSAPTLAPSPTGSASGELVKTCEKEDFNQKLGGSDPAYDFDKNGLVNTRDWVLCLDQKP